GAFLRVYAEPLRPAAIIDVAAMRGVPALLAGVFGLAMIGTVVAGLISGTRARRHEIAVLRALGATPRQRGLSIRVHAVTTMVVGLVVGLPLGVLLGRLAFRYFADLLGVAPDLRIAVLVLVGVAGGALLVAFVTAEALSRARTTRRSLPTVEVEMTGYR
ncbi:MAG: FtsX-like permease family protein, partial [Acidimicrobiales bacterium]